MMERDDRRLRLLRGLVLLMGWMAVASFAQTSSTAPASPVAVTPVADATPVFEVSTVKRNRSGSTGSHSSLDYGRFTASNVVLKNVIEYSAYGVPESRIVGGPKWLDSERFDIEAKTGDTSTDAWRGLSRDQRRLQTQGMFQRLLADRFKLTVHWETRELPVYALVAAKSGPKLHASNGAEGHSGTSAGNGQLRGEGVTMAELAQALTQELSRELGRVVVDKTGIAGRYDVTLRWTPDDGKPDGDGGTESSATLPETGPSIFTAIQEQAGLKLDAAKGPVQVLVIDHVERPTEN